MEGLVATTQTSSFWNARTVLVTGATGLVGSWLVRTLLANQAHVVALVHAPNPQSEFYRSGDYARCSVVLGDLTDYWMLERIINKYAVETVFHLAAQAIVSAAQNSPLQTFESNIRGTYNLLEACRVHAATVKQVVVASSDKAYGTQPTLPYLETMPLQGRNPYDVSKSCTDLISQAYFHSYQLPVVIARFGNIYGGGDLNWNRIIPGTIRSLINRQRPVIRSDGTFIRDYIHINDVCYAYLLLAERCHRADVVGEAFNFSPERAVSVLELVEQLQILMGCEELAPQILNAVVGEIHSQYLCADKARTLLDWQPQQTLDQGLALTIAWYRAYLAEQQ